MSKIKDLLDKQLDRNEGAKLIIDNCNIHGNVIGLVLKNQGGYDATTTCSKCFKELLESLNNRETVIEYIGELKQGKPYSRYSYTEHLEKQKDELIGKLLEDIK